MQRGVIKLNNLELKELCNLVSSSNMAELLNKFSPVNEEIDQPKEKEYDVFINENEAELVLDFMPIPGKDNNSNLETARTKIQNFLDKKSTSP